MTRDELPASVDVLVVGAGIIGTAIAARLAHHDLSVCVLDRHEPGSGCSSSGEGNILVSDKLPGADLSLALRSSLLWRELGSRLGDDIEFVKKGGLVVAHAAPELTKLISLANEQQAQGVQLRLLNHDEIGAVEPRLSKSVAGGVFYEDDAQVQPMRVVGAHVGEVRRSGGCIVSGVDVLGAEFDSDRRPRSVTTTAGRIRVGTCVVNAAGPWAGELGERLGATVPVTPRRGHVLVTEPVRTITDHKVYDASYVGDVHGGGGGWTVSAVVEATVSGTMLLGSSREFVGFSRTTNQAIVAAIASRAITLFPASTGCGSCGPMSASGLPRQTVYRSLDLTPVRPVCSMPPGTRGRESASRRSLLKPSRISSSVASPSWTLRRILLAALSEKSCPTMNKGLASSSVPLRRQDPRGTGGTDDCRWALVERNLFLAHNSCRACARGASFAESVPASTAWWTSMSAWRFAPA